MTQKYLQAKINHHYVWADYLKRWSQNNRDVYYTTKRGNIASDSVRGIAKERNFYKVTKLDNTHIEIINALSNRSPKYNQKHHKLCLARFLKRQKIQAQLEKSSKNNNEKIERFRQTLDSNGLEDLHSSNEKEVQGVLSCLANRDLSILKNDKNIINFCIYIGHQITRTKGFKDSVIIHSAELIRKEHPSVGEAIGECWWFISYMFGMNIGLNLYNTRHLDKHCMLLNDTDVPFVTSDQPVVNVYKSLSELELIPPADHECDFYFPISPSVGYMINRSDKCKQGINVVSSDTVSELNIKLSRRANIYIVGSSKESLVPLTKHIGFHSNKVKEDFQV